MKKTPSKAVLIERITETELSPEQLAEIQAILDKTGQEVSEVMESASVLSTLKTQFESLPVEHRRGFIWEQVVKAIPNMDEFLNGVASISEPEVYWVNEAGQLVVGDGCAEPAKETLGLNYTQSRTAAMSVPNRGLVTLAEYQEMNKGQIEVKNSIWVESGEKPTLALVAKWNPDSKWAPAHNYGPYVKRNDLGSRRVLRVKLGL